MDREPTDNNWTTVKEYGDNEEERIVDWLNNHYPSYQAQWTADKDVADITTIRGGIEVKSYREPYRIPSIESLCVDSGKQSVWLSDTSVSYVFVNHGYDLHVYDAQKLRQIYKKGWMLRTYNANVSQGNGKTKTMEFISLVNKSTNNTDLYLQDEDYTRWNCELLEDYSPYIITLTKDWSSFC